MRAKNDLCAVFGKIFDSGQGFAYALVVGYNAVLKRNIEITANKYPLPFYIDILDSLFCSVRSLNSPFLHNSRYTYFCRSSDSLSPLTKTFYYICVVFAIVNISKF